MNISRLSLHNRLTKVISLLVLFSVVFSLCSCVRKKGSYDGVRFTDTRHITVAVESLSNNTQSSQISANSSAIAKYIHDSVLEECNIDILFVEPQRSSDDIDLLSDVAFSGNTNILTTYYRMGSLINLKPYLDEYSDSLTDLLTLLGDDHIYGCTDDPSEVWYLTEQSYDVSASVTFIRKDWLDTLGLDVPTNREELYSCLISFRDNADILLGDEASNMIPFFVDNEPNISAKPLLDSCLDMSIDDRTFYVNGYCRVTQDGYMEGLEILNDWYLQGLLPKEFYRIRPNTKESYEPIENGYVGSFCASYDYLYENGDNSHIKALHDNRGDSANYIAVNTFENSYGEYVYWQEDCLNGYEKNVYLPKTCKDPVASFVYLNWLSNPENIKAIQNISINNSDSNDLFTYDRFLLTYNGLYPDESNNDSFADQARETALAVKQIRRGNKCIKYGSDFLCYFQSDKDLEQVYPGSTSRFVCNVIVSSDEDFESNYSSLYEEYLSNGAIYICVIRDQEWEKVMVKYNYSPR